jgi:hypothetical protein
MRITGLEIKKKIKIILLLFLFKINNCPSQDETPRGLTTIISLGIFVAI